MNVLTSAEAIYSLLRDRCPVNRAVVNHTASCVTIADFRETTNVGTYTFTFTFKSFSRRSYPERLTNWCIHLMTSSGTATYVLREGPCTV